MAAAGAATLALEHALSNARVRSAIGQKGFVPEDKFRELVNSTSIAEVLSEYGPEYESIRDLVISKAPRIFAILVCTEKVRRIIQLVRPDAGFFDEDLPLDYDNGNDSEIPSCFTTWRHFEKKGFSACQWEFLAPIWGEKAYSVSSFTPIPILEMSPKSFGKGSYGEVFCAKVHRAHQRGLYIPPGQEHPKVAVKILTNKVSFDNEYKLVRAAQHIHDRGERAPASRWAGDGRNLIKGVAGFEYDHLYYIIFEWADGDNLWKFWKNNEPSKVRDPVEWAVGEMRGIAQAVRACHYIGRDDKNKERPDKHIRHGDLKPENILRSLTRSTTSAGVRIPSSDCGTLDQTDGDAMERDDLVDGGTLIVADLGISTLNDEKTSLRESEPNRTNGTRAYLPPEAQRDLIRHTSRSDDVWALGCIFFEFLVWLLYGSRGLTQFLAEIHTRGYFVMDGKPEHLVQGSMELQPQVTAWIVWMRKHHLKDQDEGCTSRALREILNLIQNRLLVEQRQSQPDHDSEAEEALESAANVPILVLTRATEPRNSSEAETQAAPEPAEEGLYPQFLKQRLSFPPERRNELRGNSPTEDNNFRADSNELWLTLNNVFETGKSDPTFFFQDFPNEDRTELPPASLTVPPLGPNGAIANVANTQV